MEQNKNKKITKEEISGANRNTKRARKNCAPAIKKTTIHFKHHITVLCADLHTNFMLALA